MEEHPQANEELRRANKKLWRDMHCHARCPTQESCSNLSSRNDPKLFSQQIMEEHVPPHYITPKIALFSSVKDPEYHLKAFRAQMNISGVGCSLM